MIQRHYCANLNQLAADFTDYSATILRDALAKHRKISLVVPGGNTPRHYLPLLGRQALRWQDVVVTLSDERWVDASTAASNERLINQHFLAYMPEPADFVGLKTDHDKPEQAIETVNRRLVNTPIPFNLTVLGLGEDGHIASLFPGMDPDIESDFLCVAVEPPVAPSPRISLSLPLLARSRNIIIVVTGATKRQLINELTRSAPDQKIPFVWLMLHSHSPIIIFETDDA
jgi:6-phosphogluconolactonase